MTAAPTRSAGVLALARTLRSPVLLFLGALAVHKGRYVLAFGPDAHATELEHGHAYLAGVTPWVFLAVLLLSVAFVAALARGWRTGVIEPPARSFRRLWLSGSVALVAIYTGQELAEGLLAPGHAAGLTGVLGSGGWTALPLALPAGAAIAWLLRGAPELIARAAALGSRRPRTAPRARLAVRSLPRDARAPRDVLGSFLAGRGPPLPAA